MPKDLVKDKILRAYKNATLLRHFKAIGDSGAIYIYDEGTGVYRNGGRQVLGSLVQSELGIGEANNHLVSEVEGAIRREFCVDFSEFDSNPDLLCVRDGVLNLRTREIAEHSPDNLFLRSLPVHYDPNADCPAIKEFLRQIVSPRDQKLLQQFVGFILMGGYCYHKAFILVGSGDNGKTTFLNLLQRFIGEGNYSSLTLQQVCNEKFLIPQLLRKLANIAPEMGRTAIKDTESLKSLTGESSVTMQEKGERGFTAVNTAKMIFACNETPPAPTADRAFYGRFIVIPFPNKFVKGVSMIPNLVEMLSMESELSGLLNYALEGYDSLLSDDGFDYPVDYADTRTIYQAWSGSTIHKFVATMLVRDNEASIAKLRVWDEYSVFCRNNNLVAETMNAFYQELPKVLGGELTEYKERDGEVRTNVYRGIRMLCSQFDVPAPYHHGVPLAPSTYTDD